MTLETRFTNNIEEIGEAAWDALSAGRPFQSYSWYRFGEKVMAGAKPTHVILSENGQAIARASFWRVSNDPTVPDSMQVLFKRWPLLVCRAPLFIAPGWIIPDPFPDGMLEEIVRTGRRLRRKEKCSLLLFDGLSPTTARAVPRSIAYSFGSPGTILDIRGMQNFDQYVANLSYSVRKDLRRHLRKIEECGIVVTRHRTVPNLDEAERLYRTFEASKGSTRIPWVRAVLQNLEMANGTWLATHVRGQLVGWAATVEDCHAQYGIAIGFDRNIPYVYFALLCEAIRLGFEHGLHSLYWGNGTYEVKKRLGCSTFENDSLAVAF
jgi:predicted N-acyltransferase